MHDTTVGLKIRLQVARPEKTGQLHFLDWTLPTVLAKTLHISNHLALGAYDPQSPKNTSLIQTVTHARCHLAMNASERPRPPSKPQCNPMSASQFLILPRLFLTPSTVSPSIVSSLRSSPFVICIYR